MLGKRIQELRLARGWSLTELAEQAGIAKSYLSYIERKVHSNPSLQFIQKIASVLEVDPETLFPAKHRPKPAPSSPLDGEWIQLAQEAIQSGISKKEFEDFKDFLIWKQQTK